MGSKDATSAGNAPRRSKMFIILGILNGVAAALVLLSAVAPFIADIVFIAAGTEAKVTVGFLLFKAAGGDWKATEGICSTFTGCPSELSALWIATFAVLALGGVLYIVSAVCCFVKPRIAVALSPFNFTLVGLSFVCLVMRLLQLMRSSFQKASPPTTLDYELDWTAYVSVATIVVSFVASVLTIVWLPCSCACSGQSKQKRGQDTNRYVVADEADTPPRSRDTPPQSRDTPPRSRDTSSPSATSTTSSRPAAREATPVNNEPAEYRERTNRKAQHTSKRAKPEKQRVVSASWRAPPRVHPVLRDHD